MSDKFVVVDLETTGNSIKKGDKIIQFAAVVIENNQIVDQYSSLLNPGQRIPDFIEELTGLTDEMVKDAPLFVDIAPKIIEMMNGACFVAHNALFDLSFLTEELVMVGYEGFLGPVLDTVEMSRILFPTYDSYKLSDLAIQKGLKHERPHQADSDAYVTGELLLILFERLRHFPLKTLNQLYRLSNSLKSDWNEVIQEIILEKEKVIEEIPVHLEEYNGIYIKKKVNNPQELYNEFDYPDTDTEKEKLLEQAFQNYEKRIGQFKMMDVIEESFSNNHHSLIEAGTGIGKSLAYLLPALYTSVSKKAPVIISTFTTQLQNQLLKKDIPLLKKVVNFPFKAVLLKGKAHYISLDKFILLLGEKDDNYDSILTKMQIIVWLTETETGDRDELNLSSGGNLFWKKIRYTDFGVDPSHYKRDFYLNRIKEVNNAQLIIVNHSYLFSDMVSKEQLLPPCDYVIIDEAHHLDEVAGGFFGNKLDYTSVRYQLNRMGTVEKKQLAYKFVTLCKKLENDGNTDQSKLDSIINELEFEMDELFKIIYLIAKKNVKNNNQSNQINCIIEFNQSKEIQVLQAEAERFIFLLHDLLHILKSRQESIQLLLTNKKKQQIILTEISDWIMEMEKLIQSIKEMILQPNKGDIVWIELDPRAWQNKTAMYIRPLSVAEELRELFFKQKKSVILTSATLTVNGSFDYFIKRLGLASFPMCHIEQIPSPFQYNEQLKLIITNDLPEINSVPIDEYVAAICDHIISIAEATKGRLLILFTSFEMLRKTYDLIKESGFLKDFSLIAQGISGSRVRLLKNFQQFDKAILFGTNSFWEGIDIPGEDLSSLIIVRLPFSPPDEPITYAKNKEITSCGGNAFYEHSLPEAVIRFKQGFGRLIRAKQDKGIMIIFDHRILTAQYGKTFLKSIPETFVNEMDIDQTVAAIHKWLY